MFSSVNSVVLCDSFLPYSLQMRLSITCSHSYTYLSAQTVLLSHSQVLKVLAPGRVVTVYTHRYKHSLAVILRAQSGKSGSRTFTVLMLCNEGEDGEEFAVSVVDVDLYRTVTPYEPIKVR